MIKCLQLTVIALMLLFIGFETRAQITINKNNYPLKVGIDSSTHVINPGAVALPEKGENKVWDYSKLDTSVTHLYEYFDGTGEAAFPAATLKKESAYSIQGMTYEAEDYYSLNDKSFSSVGRRQKEAKYSITTVTGGANDELVIIDADIPFPKTRDYLKFPYTYGDGWKAVDIQVTKLEITVAAFQLNKAPLEVFRYRFQNRQVVGYGELTLPNKNGKPTSPINVLLVSVKDSVVDSLFMGGQPAPKPLTDAFGFMQGQTFNYESQLFETTNLGRPVLEFANIIEGKASEIHYRERASSIATSIETNEFTGSVYPTILKAGSKVNFDIADNHVIQSVQLIDLQGRAITLSESNNKQFIVPASLNAGLYIFQVNLKGNAMPFSGRMLITE